jgi:hypothetical protein
MEVYQEQSVGTNIHSDVYKGAIPKVIPEPEVQQPKKVDDSPELTVEELGMKEEAEGIVKNSIERLLIADKLGIDVSEPKDTMKFYRRAVGQKDYQEALKVAKKIAIESAQIWNLTLKKRIELARNGQADPTVTENVQTAGQDAQETKSKLETGPKVPIVVNSGKAQRQPPRPKVVATRKIIIAKGKKKVQAKKIKKKRKVMESIKSFFGKKDNSDIEARLSRAEKMLKRAKGLEDSEEESTLESLDDRMAKIESEIKDNLDT